MFRIVFCSMQQGLGVQIAFLSLLLGAISIPNAAAELPQDAISAERKSERIAVTLMDGRTAFTNPPSLVKASASYSQQAMPSQYTFTIRISANAGAPLQAVKLSSDDQIPVQFDVNSIHAYAGDRAKGQALTLAKVGGNQAANAKDTVVAFDPPIQPGNTVTIAIDVPRNPSQGIYLIGVTAYPTGSNPMGQFLGFGRFSFYSNQ
ncbi:DUF2808 domain-containing protein [Phormidesmis sp. 146-35]